MVFGNAQVHLGVKAGSGFRGHAAALKREGKFLLVHGCGRQQCRPHAPLEPVRHRGIRLGHLFRLLDRVSGALGGAVAHRDHQAELLARGDLKGGLDLAVRHGDPAGVETQLLGPQYDLLPVVPAGFLQVRGLLSDQRDVVFYAGELPVVGRKPSESPGLIQNKLDVKPALPVALGDARQQCFSRLRRDGPVLVGADRMPVLHGLEQIHNCIPPVIAAVNPRRSCPERFSGSAECLRTGALRFRSHCPAGPDSRRRESLLFGLLSRLSPAEPAGGGDNRTRSRSCRVSPPKAVNRFRHGWNSLRRCAGS